MHYLFAIAWFIFIVQEVRHAREQHCLVRPLPETWRRLARVALGMSPQEVRAVLGRPCGVVADTDGFTWRYRIVDEFKRVKFTDGRVVACDPPPREMAGELQGYGIHRGSR